MKYLLILATLVLMLSTGANAAGTVIGPVTHTLPPVRMVCTQTNGKTGAYSRQAFILALRPNMVAQIQLAAGQVRISGRLNVDGTLDLQYVVVAAGQTFGPSHMLLRPDADPVNNTFYLDDVVLKLEFQPQSAVNAPIRTMVSPKLAKCDRCNGTGLCQACQGKGHEDCKICGGSGNCQYCHGSGSCQVCAGTGSLYGKPCYACHGTGNCQYCSNKGGAQSPADGKCAFCHGKGFVNVCAACGGSGKCPACHGSGRN